MMKKGILITATTLALSMSQSFGCDIKGSTGFAPKNNLNISKFDKATNGMTEETFNAIIKRVSDVYAPVVESKGATLVMNNNWDDGTVNASAEQTDNVWTVNMYGGLARHPLITFDGFMGVVCHETGHHLGGAPKYNGTDWAANEGQADYFATLKCMKRVLEKDDNIGIVAKMKVDKAAITKCQSVYKSASEVALCERISMAGKSLALLLGELGGTPKVAFNTPDKSVVSQTNDEHPAAQCRLDTYFSGSLCDKDFMMENSPTDPTVATCIKKDGYKVGVRPLCWYKPGDGE